MAGSFIALAEGSAAATGTSIATSGSVTTLVGDMLTAVVTYDAGDTTPSLGTTFGTFTEDATLQKVSQSPRTRIYTCPVTSATTNTVTATFNGGADSRTNRGVAIIQSRGLTAYLGGVFPAYFNPGSGNDLVTTGNYNVTGQPNYMIAIGWDMAGGGVSPPNGTSSVFTSRGTFWIFADATANARVTDFRATANGNQAALFNSGFGGHNYSAILLAFSESGGAPAPVLMGQACL